MTYFTGIDVSLRSVSICVVDDRGEVCREAKIDAHVDVIVDWLHAFSPGLKSVGFEAGGLIQCLTYGLQAGLQSRRSFGKALHSTHSPSTSTSRRRECSGVLACIVHEVPRCFRFHWMPCATAFAN